MMRWLFIFLLLPLTVSAQVWPNEVPLTNLTTLRVESDQWKNTHGSQPFGIFLGDSTLSGYGNFHSGAYGEGGPSGNTNADISSRILQIAPWCNTTNLAANGRLWGWTDPTHPGGVLYYDLTTGIGASDALQYKPDWAAIRCGINDLRPPNSFPFTRIVTNMNTILGLMRSSNCLMIVMNMSPYADLDGNVPNMNAQYKNWTMTNGGGSIYFDDHLLMSNTDGYLPDLLVYEGEGTHSVHLGTNGYAYLATNFVNFLASISDIIPANRKIAWNQAGPDFYPVRNTLFNVKTYGAVGDGVTDDTASINSAITASTSNSVVYFPSGTYKVTSTLNPKSFTTFRGDNRDNSIIKAYTDNDLILLNSGGGVQIVGVTNGGNAGSFTITCSNNPPPGLVVSNVVWISQTNSTIDVTPYGYDTGSPAFCAGCSIDCNSSGTGSRSVAQALVITNINGQVLMFTPPLRYDFTNGARLDYGADNGDGSGNVSMRVGIENLCLDRNIGVTTNTPNHVIEAYNAAYGWVYNVKINHGGNRGGVCLSGRDYKMSVRKVYFNQADGTTAATGEGVLVFCGVDDCLIENNKFNGIRNPVSLDGPCMGNVISYNYVTNIPNANQNVLQPDFSTHGAQPIFNLFEGNDVHKVQDDLIRGSSSYNTFFRNFLKGRQETIGGVATDSGQGCFWVDATNHYENFVGNVLGYSNVTADIVSWTNDVFFPDSRQMFNGGGSLWVWRFQGAGYTNWAALADGGTKPFELDYTGTSWRHLNMDWFKVSTGYTNYATNTFVRVTTNSLYLASKPVWFSNLKWPPNGPDIVAGYTLTLSSNLPAGWPNGVGWPDDTNAQVVGSVMVLQGTLKGGKAGAL